MTNTMNGMIEHLHIWWAQVVAHDTTEALIDKLNTLWAQAVDIWLAGGWAMVGIAGTALVMFGLGMHVHLHLRIKGVHAVRESTWRRWLEQPHERRGPIGDLLNAAMRHTSREQLAIFFEELRATAMAPVARDLRVMRICVSVAPLLGLLGTVTGMLTTFGALAAGSGGEKTMDMVAKGISEALITTETGLVIALPGLFFHYQLLRKHERYKGCLDHLESVCTQAIYRRERRQEETPHGTVSQPGR